MEPQRAKGPEVWRLAYISSRAVLLSAGALWAVAAVEAKRVVLVGTILPRWAWNHGGRVLAEHSRVARQRGCAAWRAVVSNLTRHLLHRCCRAVVTRVAGRRRQVFHGTIRPRRAWRAWLCAEGIRAIRTVCARGCAGDRRFFGRASLACCVHSLKARHTHARFLVFRA